MGRACVSTHNFREGACQMANGGEGMGEGVPNEFDMVLQQGSKNVLWRMTFEEEDGVEIRMGKLTRQVKTRQDKTRQDKLEKRKKIKQKRHEQKIEKMREQNK